MQEGVIKIYLKDTRCEAVECVHVPQFRFQQRYLVDKTISALGCNAVWTFSPEDGGSTFLRNNGVCLQINVTTRKTNIVIFAVRTSIIELVGSVKGVQLIGCWLPKKVCSVELVGLICCRFCIYTYCSCFRRVLWFQVQLSIKPILQTRSNSVISVLLRKRRDCVLQQRKLLKCASFQQL